ncbi:hypothetical protein SIDU_16805 [Sphingobium indicum B90A]|uniref:Uncharacterized protein n=1 Tax=Sphingobium indicum (strain DSM 16412 / CCM 7286 / MTCC 6364 / B90A) TaxID=861109 RepID=A0A1L5BT31_SPHIB|nr:hypothetical protein SIDU_16805 [Sphingobium indicum B90A]
MQGNPAYPDHVGVDRPNALWIAQITKTHQHRIILTPKHGERFDIFGFVVCLLPFVQLELPREGRFQVRVIEHTRHHGINAAPFGSA